MSKQFKLSTGGKKHFVFKLDGLNCAECAGKIQHALLNRKDVITAFITIPEFRLHLEVAGDEDWLQICQSTAEIFEDGITVRLANPEDDESGAISAAVMARVMERVGYIRLDRHKFAEFCAARKLTWRTNHAAKLWPTNHKLHLPSKISATTVKSKNPVDGETALRSTRNDSAENAGTAAELSSSGKSAKLAAQLRKFPQAWREYWSLGAWPRLITVALLLIIAHAFSPAYQIFSLAAWLFSALPLAKKMLKQWRHGYFFDEISLMSIASLGAMILNERLEAVAVLFFYEIGELLQGRAVRKAGMAMQAVRSLRPNLTRLVKDDGTTVLCPTASVEVGSIIEVHVGESVPLDAINQETESLVDQQALTGESRPQNIHAGQVVAAGSIVQNESLWLKVVAPDAESAISRLIALTERNRLAKAPTERLITSFANYYTPIAVILAVILAVVPPLFTGGNFSYWIHQALTILVLACPCAIVISVPLAYVAAIGRAAKTGVLVKGGKFLDALRRADTVLFDKTGTLTTGKFVIRNITMLTDPAKAIAHGVVDGKTVLRVAALLEQYSTHPLANPIMVAAGKAGVAPQPEDAISVREVAGIGVSGVWEGAEWQLGSAERHGLKTRMLSYTESGDTVLLLTRDKEPIAAFNLTDEVRPDAKPVIEQLHKSGIKKVCIMSGDRSSAVRKVAKDLAVDEWHAQLLPEGKTELLRNKLREEAKVIYLGDGINDAPALALAQVGIAMGPGATDAATEAADVVFMQDKLVKLPFLIKLAGRVKKIAWQNIILSLGMKLILFVYGFFAPLPLWLAIIGDVGMALAAIANSVRLSYAERAE